MHDMKKSRCLSIVPRWSVVRTVQKQNVAEHSFHVAVLADWLADRHQLALDKNFRYKVLMGALLHDREEAVTGDPPGGPGKGKNWEDMVSVRGQIWAIVKLADLIEAYLFLKEDASLGNTNVGHIIAAYSGDILTLMMYVGFHPSVNTKSLFPSRVEKEFL